MHSYYDRISLSLDKPIVLILVLMEDALVLAHDTIINHVVNMS